MWKLDSCIRFDDDIENRILKRMEDIDLMAIHIEGCKPNILAYKKSHFELLSIGTSTGDERFDHPIQTDYFKEIMLAMKYSHTYCITTEIKKKK